MTAADLGMSDEAPAADLAGASAPAITHELTVSQVRAGMEKAGITATEWARENGFSRSTVMDVLLGRRAGHHGEAHRVAVALGLKAGKVVSAKGWKPTTAASATA